MLLTHSGLPIELDETTGELSFLDGLLCDGHSEKRLGKMMGLFSTLEGCDPDTLVYRAYRNIRFPEHEALWLPRDMRYDITVIQPGDANGEFFKTSGHYHGAPEQKRYPYPELYEVVAGTVAFVLQRDEFYDTDMEGSVENTRVVIAHEGESVIIPPFCGHGSINVADTVSAFSNIAVASCPVLYDAVRARHGLAVRVLHGEDGVELEGNVEYELLDEPYLAKPVGCPELGVTFGVPCYGTYVKHPETYDWLLKCDDWVRTIEGLTVRA